MADSFSLAITTPVGTVIFTGDFKFDHTPVDGERFDMQKLAEYGEKGVLCLFSDSTNAEVPGFCPSERSVFPNLDRAFSEAQGRLFVTTFASSVHRVNMILELAEKHNRYVAILGRSMLNVIAHARDLGYIRCPDSLFKPIHEVRSIPDERLLILSTGSQGEPMAAMSRIANQTHRQMKIKPGDTVIFSANPIPGNTISVVETIDKLMQQGANVIYGKGRGIHVSGHGFQEDQKLMLALTRPKFFVPVHGEHRMLVQHAKTAASLGIPEENMLIINNGDAVALTPESIYLADRVHAGIELVDSSRTGMVHDRVLKERQQLAEDGVVSASVAVDASGKVVGKPEIQVRGVVGSMARTQLDRILTTTIVSTVAEQWSKHTTGSGSDADTDWTGLQAVIERDIQRMLRRELQCEPLVLVLAHQVEGMSSNVDVPDSHPVQVRSTGVDLPIAENTVSPILEASGGKSSKPPGRRRTRSTARAAS
jgi:ribonuclease J